MILTCVDKFAGYLAYYPLRSGSADYVVEALTQHFFTFGPPERIESDAGSNLLKHCHVKVLCEHFGVNIRVSVGYHHEAVGAVERRHLDIKRRLRAVSDSGGADWETRLSGVVYSLNNEICDTTGYSPFFLYFLRHPNSPLSQLASAPKNKYSPDFVHEKLRLLSATLRQAQDRRDEMSGRYKRQFDKRYHVRDVCYREGDRLWVRNVTRASKMEDPWVGPFIVSSMVGRRHVEYITDRGVRRTHVQNTKPYEVRRP